MIDDLIFRNYPQLFKQQISCNRSHFIFLESKRKSQRIKFNALSILSGIFSGYKNPR